MTCFTPWCGIDGKFCMNEGCNKHIEIVRVGLDDFRRDWVTIFYRDKTVGDGQEVFYLALHNWPESWPEPDTVEVKWQQKKLKNRRLARS